MIRALRLAAGGLTATAVMACTPALDWRDVQPSGSAARVMFPCKPASHARQVRLAGAQVEMSMFACTAGDTTYALSFADMTDPSRVTPALAELAHAARVNVQTITPPSAVPANVPGMTPNEQAAHWQIAGRLPDGRSVQERATLFAHGTRVYQATAMGPRLDSEALEIFFGALRVGG